MQVFENYDLSKHNTFGIAATCRKFIEYDTLDELREVLADLREQSASRFLHIGGGSNLLFTTDYDGTILHSHILGKEIISRQGDEVLLRVGAGENWDRLIAWCVDNELYGLENLSYIPGEVGAGAVQNIGAYGSEICHFVERVETVRIADGALRIFSNADCSYGYRYSIFKGTEKGHYVVTHVVLRLKAHFSPDLTYGALSREVEARGLVAADLTASTLRNLVIAVRQSKLPEPEEIGSAGSFFMNPVVATEVAADLLEAYPQMPHYEVEGGVKIPAGWLIEQCGWKGKSMGRAGVYAKQALVLVNLGGATGADICRLSEKVQQEVHDKFGIAIHPEVNFI